MGDVSVAGFALQFVENSNSNQQPSRETTAVCFLLLVVVTDVSAGVCSELQQGAWPLPVMSYNEIPLVVHSLALLAALLMFSLGFGPVSLSAALTGLCTTGLVLDGC